MQLTINIDYERCNKEARKISLYWGKFGNAAYGCAAVAFVEEVEQLYETQECFDGRRVGLYRVRYREELLDLAGSLLGRPARHLWSTTQTQHRARYAQYCRGPWRGQFWNTKPKNIRMLKGALGEDPKYNGSQSVEMKNMHKDMWGKNESYMLKSSGVIPLIARW